MIPRYTLPGMEKVWSETNKYDNWLRVEKAVCWALSQTGIIPQKDYADIQISYYNSTDNNKLSLKVTFDSSINIDWELDKRKIILSNKDNNLPYL